MPRLVGSDEEHETAQSGSDGLDTIPSRPAPAKATKAARSSEPTSEKLVQESRSRPTTPAEAEDMPMDGSSGEEDDDDGDAEVFVVDKIMDHAESEEGVFILQVKWEGYTDEADMTWETERTLRENASEAVDTYYAKFGGRRPRVGEKPMRAKRGSKRQPGAPEADSAHAAAVTKKTKRESRIKRDEGATALPVGSWEKEIQVISTISDVPGPFANPGLEYDKGTLFAMIIFNSGARTSVTLDHLRHKAPQKLIDYFLQHLSFKSDLD